MAAALTLMLTVILTLPKGIWQRHDINVDSDTDTPKGNMAAALTSVLTVILTFPKGIWQRH